MDTKLTLKLDNKVIENAKVYAKNQGKSLSKIVESFLESLVNTETEGLKKDIQITPFVKSLRTGVKISSDIDVKKDYYEHILKKHQ